MVKIITLHRTPADAAAFERWYQQHLARIERLPNPRRVEISRIWCTPADGSPFYLMIVF